jgi:hypothetical protein
MISKFLDFDPFSGITQTHHYDPVTDESHIETKYPDLDNYMDACTEKRNTVSAHDGIKREWWHLGSIPLALINKLWIERGVNLWDKNNMPVVLNLLHDEFSRFKTTDGKHLPKSKQRQVFLPSKPDAS